VKLAVVPFNRAAVVYTSAAIAFATFIGVVLYHTYLQAWPKLQQRVQHFCDHEESKSFNDSTSEEGRTLATPTTTIIGPPQLELMSEMEKIQTDLVISSLLALTSVNMSFVNHWS